MKSKLIKILGVVAVVAMLASTLVALPASAISAVSASITSGTNKINNVGNYTIYATLGTQLAGTTGGTITLANTDTFVVTETTTADQVFVSGAVGALVPVLAGGAVRTVVTGGCIISFTAGGTATFTAVAATTGNYVKSFGNATVSVTGTGAITTVTAFDTITITFPTGFTVSGGVPAASISASPGWYTAPGTSLAAWQNNPVVASSSWTSNATLLTVNFALQQGDFIPANSQIQINITSAVTNPGTAGSYTINFATSKETTAVATNAITISNPVVPSVAGIASVFNSAAVPMTQYNDLGSAIGYVNTNALSGAVIKLSAGTYSSAYPSCTLPITIQGTDANAANVILKSTAGWTLSGKTVLIDSVTIDNSSGALIMASTAAGAASTISNSFVKGGVLTLSGLKDTLYGDTFTVANAAVGVNVTGGTAAIVNASTFNVAGTGTGITVAVGTTVTGSTFTGVAATGQTATGYGITVTAGTNSIKTSQFTGLATALTVSGGTTTFDSNTVNSCGYGSAPTTDTIVANAGTTALTVTNNKINSSLDYIINVTGCDAAVNVNFNQFSANVKAASNTTGTMYLNVTHNYWGGVAAPANVTTATNQVSYSNPLAVAPGASSIKAGNALDATATAGVNIISIGAAATEVGAVALASNPVTPTLPSTVTVKQYYDVFGMGATAGTVDIFFYGTTANPVTTSYTVYFYNTINGTWTVAPGVAVNVFANTVEVNYAASATSSPNLTQLGGMPWALVAINPVAPAAPAIVTPAVAATGVGISNASFSWGAVGGAATYNFVLSTSSTFAAAGNVFTASPTTNGVVVAKTLAYNTTYYWEVQSVDSTGALKSAFTTSFFTTALQATPDLTPALGAQGVGLTPTFTWTAVPGAGSYEFALAQEIGATNKFDILDYSNNTVTNGITAQETLLYSTTYNWEYRSVDSTGAKSAWTVSFFTTMDKPAVVTTTSSTAVVTTQPTIIITQPTVTQTPITVINTTGTPSSPAIPSYLLWAVIAVGAVLVIAVIVLIVRTRRIP